MVQLFNSGLTFWAFSAALGVVFNLGPPLLEIYETLLNVEITCFFPERSGGGKSQVERFVRSWFRIFVLL